MTYAANAPGEKLLFQFGDGEASEIFAHSCSINAERSLDLSSEVFQGTVPDCDNPSAPAKTVRRVKSLDVQFTGAGVADMPSFKVLLALWKTGENFNGRATQDVDSDGWVIEGPWIISSMSVGGTRGDDQNFNITLAIADEFEITYP